MHVIEDTEDFTTALGQSYDMRVLIVKISNICPVSKTLYAKLKEIVSKDTEIANQIYMLVVQDTRKISDDIALKFGVVHETPQVLIIENEDVIYYESHDSIDLEKVLLLLRQKEE